MARVYLADNKVLMCDKCDKAPAQFYTNAPVPWLRYDAICAQCAANICLLQGDQVGHDKFMKAVI